MLHKLRRTFVNCTGTLGIILTICIVTHPSLAQAGIVAPIGATPSSNDLAINNRYSQFSWNGAGLTVSGVPTGFTHGTVPGGTMWNTVGRGQDNSPYITYDLGAVYDVTELRIWNFNENWIAGVFTGFGMKNVKVFADLNANPTTFQGDYQFKKATGDATYAGEIISVSLLNVRYVKFAPQDNWDGAIFDGTFNNPGADGRGITGLSEVRFAAVPEPTSMVFGLGLTAAIGFATRRRFSA
jgi:hypothetical protein